MQREVKSERRTVPNDEEPAILDLKAGPPPLPEGFCQQETCHRVGKAPPRIVSVDKPTSDKSRLNLVVHSQRSQRPHSNPRKSGRNAYSISWGSSIAIHLVGLLLLLLILAPADFGGTGLVSLNLEFTRDNGAEDLATLEVPELSSLSDGQAEVLPTVGTLSPATSLGEFGGSHNASSAHLSGNARGSFFGIEAGGHEFVYILDMSGSMRGRRFDRASTELIRSVEQLGPHQRFYVLLFSSGTVQMFGQSDYLPESVYATAENKQRLANWLPNMFKGGSTDPRKALRIAMRMNPSAVFMLSDGEFNGRSRQSKESVLGGNADAFAIVEASANKPPIHAIAFEDESSCRNMKRLATLTQGIFVSSIVAIGVARLN